MRGLQHRPQQMIQRMAVTRRFHDLPAHLVMPGPPTAWQAFQASLSYPTNVLVPLHRDLEFRRRPG